MPPGSQRTTCPTRQVRVRRASCPGMCWNVLEIPYMPGSPFSIFHCPSLHGRVGVGAAGLRGHPLTQRSLKGSPRGSATPVPLGPAGSPSAGTGHAAPACRWTVPPLCFWDTSTSLGTRFGTQHRPNGPAPASPHALGASACRWEEAEQAGSPVGTPHCIRGPAAGQLSRGRSVGWGPGCISVRWQPPDAPAPGVHQQPVLTPQSPMPAAPVPARRGLPSRECGRSDSQPPNPRGRRQPGPGASPSSLLPASHPSSLRSPGREEPAEPGQRLADWPGRAGAGFKRHWLGPGSHAGVAGMRGVGVLAREGVSAAILAGARDEAKETSPTPYKPIWSSSCSDKLFKTKTDMQGSEEGAGMRHSPAVPLDNPDKADARGPGPGRRLGTGLGARQPPRHFPSSVRDRRPVGRDVPQATGRFSWAEWPSQGNCPRAS